MAPRSAQRLQHGYVRVLRDLKGVQIIGLEKVFDNADSHFKEDQIAAEHCKHICYSDIRCQYWTYAPRFGCWVEDASKQYSPSYPLTSEGFSRTTPFALNSIAGEYIQHYCPISKVSAELSLSPPLGNGCIKKGVRFEPPDMSFQDRTLEANFDACIGRCRKVSECVYASYWPDGSCHLADKNTKEVKSENDEVISGPTDCKYVDSPQMHTESAVDLHPSGAAHDEEKKQNEKKECGLWCHLWQMISICLVIFACGAIATLGFYLLYAKVGRRGPPGSPREILVSESEDSGDDYSEPGMQTPRSDFAGGREMGMTSQEPPRSPLIFDGGSRNNSFYSPVRGPGPLPPLPQTSQVSPWPTQIAPMSQMSSISQPPGHVFLSPERSINSFGRLL
eukprot:TRINITY_DN41997_c0_g1_i1.p1 TRINITY_DN41997_c0_g1~~TRINITY_DN41997_c0_g1_i1.p1  ORF type:complete len:460 (+),score=55.65 TRINITY_DN41997_c0_g1_i1:207-1382(+)